MRALGLLLVFIAARVAVLIGREPSAWWSLVAFIGEDLVVAALYAGIDATLVRRPSVGWTLYGLLAAYSALNAAVARVLFAPLSLAMLRGARSALADSITHHVTLETGAVFLTVAIVAFVGPLVARRTRIHWRGAIAFAITGFALHAGARPLVLGQLGAAAALHHPLVALSIGVVPRIGAREEDADWRKSPFPSTAPVEASLANLRGSLRGRNVLVMLLESTAAKHLALYGADVDPMPTVSELGRSGLLFENAYAVYPESIKGLFATLHSRYPALDVAVEAHGKLRLPSIASVLREAGYRTGLFHAGRFRYLGMDAIVRDRGFDALEDAGAIGGNHESSFGVEEPSCVRRILAWIDGLGRSGPFFAMYLPVAGHHPYETPERGPFSDAEEIGRYRNALHAADRALAQLLDGLRSRGLLDQTLIVLAGDHGEAFLDHPGNYGHTFFLYEENVRVPLVIAAPGSTMRARRIAETASLIDLAPTILDLLGNSPPAEFQGETLLTPRERMALFFTDYAQARLGLRDGPWKLLHEVETGRVELFNIADDPNERRDRSADDRARTQAYRELLERWAKAQRHRIEAEGARRETQGEALRQGRP